MSKVLWAMHLMGPDDVYAAPSKERALEVANNINLVFSGVRDKPYAVVVPWDGPEEAHFVQQSSWLEEWEKSDAPVDE